MISTQLPLYTGSIPDRNKPREEFNQATRQWIEWTTNLVPVMNQVINETNATADTINNQAQNAETNANLAVESAQAAANSEQKAYKWAENDEDIEVEAGKYSAKHWAIKASQYVASLPEGTINDNIVSTTDTWSSNKISTELSNIPSSVLKPQFSGKMKDFNNDYRFSVGGWVGSYPQAGGSTYTKIYLYPFIIPNNITINEIYLYIYTAETDTNMLVGIYDTQDGLPGNLLYGSTQLDTSVSGILGISDLNIDISGGGLYWLAIKTNGDGSGTYAQIGKTYSYGLNTEAIEISTTIKYMRGYTYDTGDEILSELPNNMSDLTKFGYCSEQYNNVIKYSIVGG